MDSARSIQVWIRNDSAPLSKATARVRVLLLTFALSLGATSTANAVALTINTDTSWLATNALPAATWNTNPSFNTTGWVNAFVSTVTPAPCFNGADCIWYDDQTSATQFAWLRKTFTISAPVSSAVINGGIDDDGDIYVNGTLVYSSHNGTAGSFGPIDVAPYLVQGVNLIAVAAEDNFQFGHNHVFVASLQVQTIVPVPTLSPWMLAILALALASFAIPFVRRRT
jgi:hypothetical protein